ncbi:MAG: hypothetical protein JWP87_1306 [Labilithrix sp.]|nr:hypothetical protein [Labilithrix sp.]
MGGVAPAVPGQFSGGPGQGAARGGRLERGAVPVLVERGVHRGEVRWLRDQEADFAVFRPPRPRAARGGDQIRNRRASRSASVSFPDRAVTASGSQRATTADACRCATISAVSASVISRAKSRTLSSRRGVTRPRRTRRRRDQRTTPQALQAIERLRLRAVDHGFGAPHRTALRTSRTRSTQRGPRRRASPTTTRSPRATSHAAPVDRSFAVPSTSSFRSKRARTSVTPNDGTRAAASSTASGSASSRRTTDRAALAASLSAAPSAPPLSDSNSESASSSPSGAIASNARSRDGDQTGRAQRLQLRDLARSSDKSRPHVGSS